LISIKVIFVFLNIDGLSKNWIILKIQLN